MSTITATPSNSRSWVRLDLDFTDVCAPYCYVTRTNQLTGETKPVRLHGSTSVAQTSSVPQLLVSDTFTRTVSSQWGVPDYGSGYSWTTSGGSATDYNTTGTTGTILMSTLNVTRHTNIGSLSTMDSDLYCTVSLGAVATGAACEFGVKSRFLDTNNYYDTSLIFNTDQTLTFRIRTHVGGSLVVLTSTTLGFNYSAGGQITMRVQTVTGSTGTTVQAKAWLTSGTEPTTWTITATDATVTWAGQFGTRAIANTGNTNVSPTFTVDNFSAITWENVATGTTAGYANMYAGYKTVLYDTEMPLDTPVYYTATAAASQLNVNADFEGSFYAPWTSVNSATLGITLLTSLDDSPVLRLNGDGSTASPQAKAEYVVALPGAHLSMQANVAAAVATGSTQAFTYGVNWYNSALALLSTTSASGTAPSSADGVGFFQTQLVAPANTAFAAPFIQITGTPTNTTYLYVDNIQLLNIPSTATSSAVTVASLGSCWLKDPAAQLSSVRVDFCLDPNPLCVPGEGVFFQSMDTAAYAANSAAFNVNNQADPVVVSKTRSSRTSTLNLVARTFADRDRLVALLATGRTLLFQAPAEYGVPDTYMACGNINEVRIHPDHRFPIRLFQIPYAKTTMPDGPSQGVAAAQWSDMDDVYASWGAITSAGITWLQVLQGVIG